jgi:hypothetical protein
MSSRVNRQPQKNGELFYEVKTITPLRDAEGTITHFAPAKISPGTNTMKPHCSKPMRNGVARTTSNRGIGRGNTAFLTEISERKKAQKALEQSQKELSASEERARHLIQYAPAAIYEMDFSVSASSASTTLPANGPDTPGRKCSA